MTAIKNMKPLYPIFILLSVFFILLLSSTACEIEQPMRLDKNDKKTIDTLYMTQSNILRKNLDSICKVEYDSLIRIEVDSILKIRLEEIARQRARFEKRQRKNEQ